MRWLYQKHHFFLLQIWNFFFWAGFHLESHLDTHCLVKDPLILENWRFAHMICRFGLHDLHFWHWHLTEKNKNGNVNTFCNKILHDRTKSIFNILICKNIGWQCRWVMRKGRGDGAYWQRETVGDGLTQPEEDETG